MGVQESHEDVQPVLNLLSSRKYLLLANFIFFHSQREAVSEWNNEAGGIFQSSLPDASEQMGPDSNFVT